MNRARMKLPAIIGSVVGSGLALLAWSQTWFGLVLASGAGAHANAEVIAVPGSVASPALAALGLAGLALAAALALAGPAIRVVLGALEVVLGGCIVLASWLALADPVAAVSASVTEATGVAGKGPTAELVGAAVATAWPAVALVGGIIVAVAGVVVLASGTRWPSSSRRYRSGLAPADEAHAEGRGTAERAVDDWDELSRGDDPTDVTTDDADR